VFAYGQTGSGKTFTITGGDEKYNDRGLIPRTLSCLFSKISERSDMSIQVYISYLEIYSDDGYDLLLEDTGKVRDLKDLPRVVLRERNGEFHLSGLSSHLANNEEEALNYLFLGDTNRRVSETPMNDVSSRSHCIFMVKLMMSKPGSEVFRTSKIHLVDLAGSERVAKTHAEGKLLTEAMYINKSLSMLEKCILQLGKGESHVSYRDSFMTSVLRDSLGGNCKTVMIATLSVHASNIPETISTCRFAQRVAMVKNTVTVNEELDPRLVIARLKKEVRELKEEIALLTGEDRAELTESEIDRVRQLVMEYLADPDPDAKLTFTSFIKFHHAHRIFKEIVKRGGGAGGLGSGGGGGGGSRSSLAPAPAAPAQQPPPQLTADAKEQLKTLGLQLQQRDNEIAALVSMLHTKRPSEEVWTQTGVAQESGRISTLTGKRSGAATGAGDGGASSAGSGGARQPSSAAASAAVAAVAESFASQPAADVRPIAEEHTAALLDQDLLLDRTKAFELFRRSYRKNEVIEENKATLKDKYAEAKDLAARINASKDKINNLKALIEQLRVEKAMQGILEGSGEGAEEEAARLEIEREKTAYKESFAQMKAIKAEIDGLHQLLEQSRVRLQKDFEAWHEVMSKPRALQGPASLTGPTPPSSARTVTSTATTGNSEADADIAAFYKMKEEMLARKGRRA
jgi:kinesin family protein 6/9